VLVIAATPGVPAQSLDWARRDGGSANDGGKSVAIDSAGNTFVLGTFIGQAEFGAGEVNATQLTNAGAVTSQDLFLAKYWSDGTLAWAVGIGGVNPESGGDAGQEFAGGVAVDVTGSVYIAGTLFRFTTLADLGNGVVLTQPGAFVARFDTNGNAVWAASLDTTGQAWAIDVDADGNTYVGGGAAEPGVGGQVPTIWKLNPGGVLAWAIQAPGGSGRSLGIAAADPGTVRVGGRFTGTATFGSEQPGETTLSSTNATVDGFIAAYDAAGTMLWARQTESASGAWGNGLATDGDGNSYVTGAMHGATTFGAGEPSETTLVATQVGDGFVAKYGATGGLVWARPIHANANTYGMAIATDAAGSAYVTGFFGGIVTFGAGEAAETSFGSLGSSDVFVAKYETNGGFEWAKHAGGTTAGVLDESGEGIAADAAGNVHITGYFVLTTTFGLGELGATTLEGAAGDIFVARYQNDSVPPPPGLDLDIAQFRVASRVSLAKNGNVTPLLVVRNNGAVTGTATASVIGVQNGIVVYSQTLDVSDPPGGGRTSYALPAFAPQAAGDIEWTVTITDQDVDTDEVRDVTRVL
jgi:hypothetical protein